MNTIKDRTMMPLYRNACILMIWLIDFYASIIQYKYIEIPYGMLIIGVAILVFYCLMNSETSFDLHKKLTEESIYMLIFMIYMFTVGTLVSINRSGHFSQAFTCMQYLFISLVISSIIKESGTDSFHVLLLIKAIVLAVVFITNPVNYEGDRYSISTELNPNGLGMMFASGIWAILYRQQKKRIPLIFIAAVIGVLGYCIIITGSRKSLIAAGISIILWVVFCFFPSLKKKGKVYGAITLCAMIILSFVIWQLFSNMYSESGIANRMGNLFYETTEGKRSNMYRAGLDMLRTSPLFGLGFQGFKYNYGTYSHATLVEIPVSCGIVGSLLYFFIYFISIRKTYRLYRITKQLEEFKHEHMRVRMIIILWVVMLFYTICIIHQYQFESFVIFGIIFGETSFVESKLSGTIINSGNMYNRSKYIKNV